jgi:pimeloyl-ACP methyl ester carboxylesterase
MKIDEKIKVNLNGLRQKIHIVSNDTAKPILLFLHGGPGVINRHLVTVNHKDLLDSFTIVGWDQRGSGGSYWGAKEDTLTVQSLTDDAHELVKYLTERFNKDKIFIIGGSWGSELGAFLAYRYPERIAAFVGFGQVVDGEQNEALSYEFAYTEAKKAGNQQEIAILESVGPPKKGVYKGGLDGLLKQRKIMMKYGGYSLDKKKRGFKLSFLKPMLFSGEYSPTDIIGMIKGYKFVLGKMWPEIGAGNLANECPEFTMPYFIFDGVHDRNTPAALVNDYFQTIRAPHKELIWFENSGHNPMGDEPDRFKSLLRSKLLSIADDLRTQGVKI